MNDELIPPAATRLQALVGTWDVTGVIHEGESNSALAGRWRFERAADGWGVRGRMTTTIDGLGTLDEDELIAYDRAGGRVHMVGLNALALRDHAGDWTAEDILEVEFEGTEAGREVVEHITVRFESRTRVSSLIVEHADGELVATTELVLVAAS